MLRLPRHDDTERGQALVEFALTLPILLLLVLGIIDLARVMFAYTQVVDAARQGVRYGIVEGLTAPYTQYFDCAEIAQTATDLTGVVPVNVNPSTDVYYYVLPYETSDNEPPDPSVAADLPFITWCDPALTISDFANPVDFTPRDFVISVRAHSAVEPVTPILMPFFSSGIQLEYTARRTVVVEGADYTTLAEYPVQPPRVQNFTGDVDCTTGYVDFSWTCYDISGIPNGALIEGEILNALTHKPDGIAAPSLDPATCDSLTNLMTCSDCTQVDPVGGYGVYYMQTFISLPVAPLSSPPSANAVITCPGPLVGVGPCHSCKGEIHGVVWEDDDEVGEEGYGIPDVSDSGDAEQGIPQVKVVLTYWGDNRVDESGSGDDVVIQATTDENGAFHFIDLPASLGSLNEMYYSITIDPSAVVEGDTPPLEGRTLHIPISLPRPLTLTKSEPVLNSINFGYSAPPPPP